MKWYIKVLKNYVTFSGRARRKEFWMFILFNAIFAFVAMMLDKLCGTTFKFEMHGMTFPMSYGWIYVIYGIAVLLPSLAVWVRRLHDIGKSGWLVLISFIPIVGAIILLVWACTEGQMGDNRFGADPKQEEMAA